MGLDSRLDEHGNPLPQEMYDALHAGDDSEGGFNSNVLILVHIPGDGSKSTAISIPRDDYVTLDPASCATSPCKGKIKQAYGFAYAREKDKLTASGVKDALTLDQQSRDAGRLAESNTVGKFLGDVPVDHFVEVTLAAFFQIAQAVQPITVCLNEDTKDSYSGADFKKGKQQIDASQAMAFVRQRRDPDQPLFTDLDRTRRQQAFIVSLLRQLQDGGTLNSPSKLRALLDITKQNTAIDKDLDPLAFAQRASALFSEGVSLYTLPVKDFGTDDAGESINIVDTGEIHGIVANLLGGDAGATTTTPPTTTTAIPAASGIVLNVVNSSGMNGLAAQVQTALATRGFTRGTTGTGAARDTTTLTYGTGADAAATALAEQLGLTATKSTSVEEQTVQLTLGADARTGPIANLVADQSDPSTSAAKTTAPTSSTTPPAPVSATAPGANAPAATDLSQMDTGGIPCVR
ncbi:LCP family protein [Nocardia heshunensis]